MIIPEVMIITGAGQISVAIARRIGFGYKIILGDINLAKAKAIAQEMNEAGYDVEPKEIDLSSRDSIKALIARAQSFGNITKLVNGAGVSPIQAPVEVILKVDLYGTAVLLEEVGKVICQGGSGVTISSRSGWKRPLLTANEEQLLATAPTEELLSLDLLQPRNIEDSLHAYQLAKCSNNKRVISQSVVWGRRQARLNGIDPGIIMVPLASDKLYGLEGQSYNNAFAKPAIGKLGIADEAANLAEILLSDTGVFVTGSTFLVEEGTPASCCC